MESKYIRGRKATGLTGVNYGSSDMLYEDANKY